MVIATVGTSTYTIPVAESFQKKCFYANGRWWAFYYTGADFGWETSIDGIDWTGTFRSYITLVKTPDNYDIWYDEPNNKICLARTMGSENRFVFYNQGTANADGTITGDFGTYVFSSATEKIAYDNIDNWNSLVGQGPKLVKDSNGYPWISWLRVKVGNWDEVVIKASATDGSAWANSPTSLWLNRKAGGESCFILPLTSGKMFAISVSYGTIVVQSRLFNGTSWETPVSLGNLTEHPFHCDMVADGDNVHFVFVTASPFDIVYRKYIYGTGWQTAETVESSVLSVVSHPAITLTRTDYIRVFYLKNATTIKYRDRNLGVWQDAVVISSSESGITCVSSSYRTISSGYCIFFKSGTSPIYVKFESYSSSTPHFKTITELLETLDTKSRTKSVYRTATELLGLRDWRAIGNEVYQIIIESLGLEDSKSRAKSYYRSKTEYLGGLDSYSQANKSIHRTIAESLGFSHVTWGNRKSHLINPASGAGTEYQIPIRVYYGKGKDSEEEVWLGKNDNERSEWKISIDATKHDDYGLTYPVTYVFILPDGVTSAKALYKYTPAQGWTQFDVKTPSDFFNGINCVRWNYTNHLAYVSIRFNNDSHDIFLKFTDATDNAINVKFSHIPRYYDDRKCALSFELDDVGGGATDISVLNVLQTRNIWVTLGIQTANPSWTNLQTEINQGYVEAASHTRNHPLCPYADPTGEIVGSRNDIRANLNLPDLYKKGTQEYVPNFMSPYGSFGKPEVEAWVVAKYLRNRGNHYYLGLKVYGYVSAYLSVWDSENGGFLPDGIGEQFDGRTVAQMNAYFDFVYNNNAWYKCMCHPSNMGTRLSDLTAHADYIKNKLDVWYVGSGAYSMYQAIRLFVTFTPSSTTPCELDFSDVRFLSSDATTILNAALMNKLDGVFAEFYVKVNEDLSSEERTIYISYNNPSASEYANSILAKFAQIRGQQTVTQSGSTPNSALRWEISSGKLRGYTYLSNITYRHRGYIMFVVPKSWINGKYLRWKWSGTYSGSLATVAEAKIYDGRYFAYQITDFGNANTTITIKGNGLLQTLATKTVSADWDATQDVLVNVNGASQNYVTIMIMVYDDWTDRMPDFKLEWLEVNTSSGGIGNIATINFNVSVYVAIQNIGSNWNAGGFYRKYVDPEPTNGSWGEEEGEIFRIKSYFRIIIELLGLEDVPSKLIYKIITELLGTLDIIAKTTTKYLEDLLLMLEEWVYKSVFKHFSNQLILSEIVSYVFFPTIYTFARVLLGKKKAYILMQKLGARIKRRGQQENS